MNKSHNSIHILLVEDDVDLSSSLSSYLNSAGCTVTAVGSCRECYVALSNMQYQVALVDLSLPDQSGFVLVEYLRANTSMKVIILTAHESIEDRVRGYAAGAHNYFVKPVDACELQAAIMSLANYDLPVVANTTDETWRLVKHSWQLQIAQGNTIKLTALEMQFLELLTSAAGQTVPRETILNAIYKRYDEHSGRALDSMVRRLRAKISTTGHASPIMTAHAVGFCFSSHVIVD